MSESNPEDAVVDGDTTPQDPEQEAEVFGGSQDTEGTDEGSEVPA